MIARMLKSRGLMVIEDARARKRDNFAPVDVKVTYVEDGSVGEMIDAAVAQSPCPVALVTDTGRVFVLSSGGSGEIVVVGGPTAEQDDAALAIMDVLFELWGVKQGAPKKSRGKKNVEQVEEPTIEPEQVDALLGVVNAIEEFAAELEASVDDA